MYQWTEMEASTFVCLLLLCSRNALTNWPRLVLFVLSQRELLLWGDGRWYSPSTAIVVVCNTRHKKGTKAWMWLLSAWLRCAVASDKYLVTCRMSTARTCTSTSVTFGMTRFQIWITNKSGLTIDQNVVRDKAKNRKISKMWGTSSPWVYRISTAQRVVDCLNNFRYLDDQRWRTP